jgi:hypothetical protein
LLLLKLFISALFHWWVHVLNWELLWLLLNRSRLYLLLDYWFSRLGGWLLHNWLLDHLGRLLDGDFSRLLLRLFLGLLFLKRVRDG